MKPALLTLLTIIIFQTLAFSQEQALIPYRKGKLWGLANENKEIVLEPQFDSIGFLSEGLAAAKKDGKWGYINAKGTVKFPFIYDDAKDFSEGWAMVNNMYNIDSLGNTSGLKIPFYEPPGRPPITLPRKISNTIDSLKRIYAAEDVDLISTKNFSLFKIFKNKKYGLFHIKKGLILPIEYETIYPYSNYLFIEQKSKWGIFNINELKITMPLKYSRIYNLKYTGGKSYFKVTTIGGQNGYINEEGTEFFEALSQEQALIPYRKGNLWGLANENKEIILEPQFEETRFLSEGLAAAKKDGKWGYINAKGIIKIPFIYDYVGDFSQGYAVTGGANGRHYINLSGEKSDIYFKEPILPLLPLSIDNTIDSLKGIYSAEYVDFIDYQDFSLFTIFKDKNYGLFHIKKGLILPFEYELITHYPDENYLFVKKNSQWGVFDINKLKITIPVKYSKIDELQKAGEKYYFKVTIKDGQDGYINEEGAEFFE